MKCLQYGRLWSIFSFLGFSRQIGRIFFYLGLGFKFEFGPQRITNFAFMCPKSVPPCIDSESKVFIGLTKILYYYQFILNLHCISPKTILSRSKFYKIGIEIRLSRTEFCLLTHVQNSLVLSKVIWMGQNCFLSLYVEGKGMSVRNSGRSEILGTNSIAVGIICLPWLR